MTAPAPALAASTFAAPAFGALALPDGPFDMIMADPPWHFRTRSAKGETKSPQAHYATMSIDAIARLPVARQAAPDCLLWLWATAPMLPDALGVLAAWGFAFKTMGYWSKRGDSGALAFGTGYILRCAGEPFLIGTIGSPKTTRSVRSVIEGPRREHSRKPEQAYDAAQALMPGARRLDLFSRQTRPGWTGWGLESDKFDAKDSA